jgi:hypothetical protein
MTCGNLMVGEMEQALTQPSSDKGLADAAQEDIA